jgi:uncharacterized iron-regulated protein
MRTFSPWMLLTAACVSLAFPIGMSSALAQEVGHGSGGPRLAEVQAGVDYRVYDRQGRPASLSAIVEAARSADVVLVGEEHDDLVGHGFQGRLLLSLLHEVGAPAAGNRQIVFSMEMFERDVQYVLDEYLAGLISEEHFLKSARPWPEYETRYRPLVELARSARVPVVAANAPRRYVSRVTANGPQALEDLSDVARSFLPPLPYPGPSRLYREQWDALMTASMQAAVGAVPVVAGPDSTGQGGGAVLDASETPSVSTDGTEAGPDHGSYAMSPHVIQAQALWDAAMGHAVAEALIRHVGALVLHIAGSFHIEKGTGVPERIVDYRPGTHIVSVVMTGVEDITVWSDDEYGDLGDFVVLTRSASDEGADPR